MLEKLYKQFPIMEKLKEEKIFYIRNEDDVIEILEGCDEWFSMSLNKESAREISDFFLALSEQIDCE